MTIFALELSEHLLLFRTPSYGRASTILGRMPDTRDLQFGVREAVPEHQPGARDPGLPETAMIEKNARRGIDGQKVAQE